MDFVINIFNGFSTDSEKILNSVKAAYMYADKVKVFDPLLPNSARNTIEREAKRLYSEADIMDLIKRNPSLNRELGLSERFYNLASIKKAGILNQEESISLQRYFNALYMEMVLSKSKETESGRGYLERKVLKNELVKLGVELIDPSVCFALSLDTHYVEDLFLNEKGFKISNDRLPGDEANLKLSAFAGASNKTIASLPGFANVSVDQLGGIRKELDKYIIPYRSAMIEMAEAIKSIPDTESFEEEYTNLYLKKIQPKVEEIRAAVHDNNFFKNVFISVVTDEKVWGSFGAMLVGLTSKQSWLDAIGPAGFAGLVGFASADIAKSMKSTLEADEKNRKKEMYFLYQMEKEVAKYNN